MKREPGDCWGEEGWTSREAARTHAGNILTIFYRLIGTNFVLRKYRNIRCEMLNVAGQHGRYYHLCHCEAVRSKYLLTTVRTVRGNINFTTLTEDQHKDLIINADNGSLMAPFCG